MHSYGTPRFLHIWLKKLFEKHLSMMKWPILLTALFLLTFQQLCSFGTWKSLTLLTNMSEAVSAKLPLKPPEWFFEIVFVFKKQHLHYQSIGNGNELGDGVLRSFLVFSTLALLRKLDFITLPPKKCLWNFNWRIHLLGQVNRKLKKKTLTKSSLERNYSTLLVGPVLWSGKRSFWYGRGPPESYSVKLA